MLSTDDQHQLPQQEERGEGEQQQEDDQEGESCRIGTEHISIQNKLKLFLPIGFPSLFIAFHDVNGVYFYSISFRTSIFCNLNIPG